VERLLSLHLGICKSVGQARSGYVRLAKGGKGEERTRLEKQEVGLGGNSHNRAAS
jgi:hypothetical protein